MIVTGAFFGPRSGRPPVATLTTGGFKDTVVGYFFLSSSMNAVRRSSCFWPFRYWTIRGLICSSVAAELRLVVLVDLLDVLVRRLGRLLLDLLRGEHLRCRAARGRLALQELLRDHS